ncbi:MAG: 3-oxoacyl-[acyl-carrier-protein] reductase [Eubacteriales bacterium]|nr:3-oxoacyl-[acyl-carrier-protein] reductase [Eubacteriales bacterium]
MKLEGRTAIITGSGRGLGKSIAMKLAKMGARIVLNDIASSDTVDATCAEMKEKGYSAVVAKGDVRDENDVESMIKTAINEYGSVDILVNNAGITRDMPLIKMGEKDWDDVLDINLKGAFICTKAAVKEMMKKRYGRIINVSSVAGLMGNRGQANYSASKAGLIGLTKTTAKEYASRNILCNAVAPGVIESKMTDVLPEKVKEKYLENIPLGRFGTPDDVADVIGFLASDDSDYITGQVIHIDGGLVM